MTDFFPPSLVLWGAGGHARVVAEAIKDRADPSWEITGIVVDVAPCSDEMFFGLSVHYSPEPAKWMASQRFTAAFVAIGDNISRMHKIEALLACGLEVPVLVHESAVLSSTAALGPGVFLGPTAVVNAAARLGTGVIVNSGAVVEHDCQIGNGAHIAPGALLGGHVEIGARVLVGLGSRVLPGVRIGADAQIGAGSVVVHDVPAGVTVCGVPARIVSKSESDH